jgi:hypothetical protein
MWCHGKSGSRGYRTPKRFASRTRRPRFLERFRINDGLLEVQIESGIRRARLLSVGAGVEGVVDWHRDSMSPQLGLLSLWGRESTNRSVLRTYRCDGFHGGRHRENRRRKWHSAIRRKGMPAGCQRSQGRRSVAGWCGGLLGTPGLRGWWTEKAVAGATALQNASRPAFGGLGFYKGPVVTMA